MFEFMKMAFAFGLGFIGAVALYVAVGYGAYRLVSWAWGEIHWKIIVWKTSRQEEKERWAAQKAELIEYAKHAAGEK